MGSDIFMEDFCISVIIPIYNSDKFLRKNLESLKNQTFQNFEAILIDDGSTDKSGIIADEFAEFDKRFKVFHIKNGGVSNARNIGISNAKGKWIYFLDSDDEMEPNMLQVMIDNSKNSEMTVTSVFMEYTNNSSNRIICNKNMTLRTKNAIGNYLISMNPSEKDLLLNYLWNRIFLKEVIDNNCIRFNTKITLGEDFLFICDFLKCCSSIILLDTPLYHYYIRGNISLSTKFNSNEYQRRLLMREALKNLYLNFGVWNNAADSFAINEGRYLIYGMEKINLPSCTLSSSEKKLYIKQFLSEENIGYISKALRETTGINAKVWSVLIRLKSEAFIKFYLDIRKKYLK